MNPVYAVRSIHAVICLGFGVIFYLFGVEKFPTRTNFEQIFPVLLISATVYAALHLLNNAYTEWIKVDNNIRIENDKKALVKEYIDALEAMTGKNMNTGEDVEKAVIQ